MDPYVLAELKTYILTVVAGGGVLVGGLSAWLGHLISARILRRKEARQKLQIELYNRAVEPFLSLYVAGRTGTLSSAAFQEFEITKLKVASSLTLFASQDVMDAFNVMADYVSDVYEGKQEGTEARVMAVGTAFLNTARRDIGLGRGAITYRGHRALPGV